MIYLIPIFLTILGASLFELKNNERYKILKNFIWLMIWSSLVLIIGLRFKVGGDTINYMGDYEWRPKLSDWELNILDPYQPGYTILCSIGKTISDEFYVFQIIHAIIINSLLIIFLQKSSKYPFSSLLAIFLCCYLYFSTEILREVIAVLIFCINIRSYLYNEVVLTYFDKLNLL